MKVIEIIDIECVLLSFFSENFVSTKWRIYKGIQSPTGGNFARLRGVRLFFFCQRKFLKRYRFEILNGKLVYKRF